MSNYSQIVQYGPKDTLSPGDPNKVIHGTQLDAELQAISTAIGTKYDSINPPGSIALSGTPVLQSYSASAGPSIEGLGPVAGAMVDITPDKGSFTGIFSGYVASPSPTITWCRIGLLVFMCIQAFTGTSNSTVLQLTNSPAGLSPPATTQNIVVSSAAFNNGGVALTGSSDVVAQVQAGTSNIAFLINGFGWTNTGTKGTSLAITFAWIRV